MSYSKVSSRLLAMRVPKGIARTASALVLASLALPLDGCAVVALPCRLVSATLKIVPVVGHPAAIPFDACSAAID
ncbi:DUF6726 family protein [Paraburkholderia sp. J67]|uniref:DUF6726 family protein n=1 Tax=Paraburkholderia sp. J67 TaxID=2805435 RepID=UPI0039F52278